MTPDAMVLARTEHADMLAEVVAYMFVKVGGSHMGGCKIEREWGRGEGDEAPSISGIRNENLHPYAKT